MAMSAELHGLASGPGASPPIHIPPPAPPGAMGHVAGMTPEHVHRAVQHVRAAQQEGPAPDFLGRRVWKRRFRDWLYNNDQLVLELVNAETRKTWGDLLPEEIAPTVDALS